MKTSELFRKTLKQYLNDEGHGAQSRLADEIGIDRKNLNGFLNGRKMLSESKREEIAEKLGYSYIDFLLLGMKMFRHEFEFKETEDDKSLEKYSIIIDFSILPEILEHFKQKSKHEVRSLDKQLLYELKKIYRDDKRNIAIKQMGKIRLDSDGKIVMEKGEDE